jgi:hypothetical protein
MEEGMMKQRKKRTSSGRQNLFLFMILSCVLLLGHETVPMRAHHASLPDLTVESDTLRLSIDFVRRAFRPTSCAAVEGCVSGIGTRKLMRFAVLTPNLGQTDLILGDPAENPDLFIYSPCHRHYHFEGYAVYELLKNDMERTRVLIGRKQAFCLLDSLPYTDEAGDSSGYDCDFQGITAGWADIYDNRLDCQWLDVTGVAAGNYLLRVTLNPEGRLAESDYTNNVAVVPVTIR